MRIGYSVKDGGILASSGRHARCLKDPRTRPTTVYGWNLTDKDRAVAPRFTRSAMCSAWNMSTRIPYAGIKWHEEAVYKNVAGQAQPMLGRRETYRQYPGETVSRSRCRDPNGIRSRSWNTISSKGLIAKPERLRHQRPHAAGNAFGGGQEMGPQMVSADKGFAGKTSRRPQPAVIELAAGQQANFLDRADFFAKVQDRDEGRIGYANLRCSKTSTGTPRLRCPPTTTAVKSAMPTISHKLFKGRQYIVRLRLVHPGPDRPDDADVFLVRKHRASRPPGKSRLC